MWRFVYFEKVLAVVDYHSFGFKIYVTQKLSFYYDVLAIGNLDKSGQIFNFLTLELFNWLS